MLSSIRLRRRFILSITCISKVSTTAVVMPQQLCMNIYIDPLIQQYLHFKKHQRKKRIYLKQSDDIQNIDIAALKRRIEQSFSSLLAASLPYDLRIENSSVARRLPKLIQSDLQLREACIESAIKGMPLSVFVDQNPVIPWPPLDVTDRRSSYLSNLHVNPDYSATLTILSFYKFCNIENPDETVKALFNLWTVLKVTGRVYVATEGVNAQMCIPSSVLPHFRASLETSSFLSDVDLNIDHEIKRSQWEQDPPFSNLHIRRRNQIVVDGLNNAQKLDCTQNNGDELDPMAWHEKVSNLSATTTNGQQDKSTIVFDCRNDYESNVGKFDNAVPLNTTYFRESFAELEKKLSNVSKDTSIMTYCTGGIRCEKINAYLVQKLGFTSVSRLKGGIVAYTREMMKRETSISSSSSSSSPLTVSEAGKGVHRTRSVVGSIFKGVNYVFDERMSTRVTPDVLSSCATCGNPSDSLTNCANVRCHARFVQCTSCCSNLKNCCSSNCFNQLEAIATSTATTTEAAAAADLSTSSSFVVPVPASTNDASNIIDYCGSNSSKEPQILNVLREEVEQSRDLGFESSRMLSGHLQGRLLASLASLSRAKSILELGTFSGYSALCLAEGAAQSSFPFRLITVEHDHRAAAVASKYFALSEFGKSIQLVQSKAVDFLSKAREEKMMFDLVYLDADKRAYLSYVKILLGNDAFEDSGKVKENGKFCMLEEGALIIADNTLFRGLVPGIGISKFEADVANQQAAAAARRGGGSRKDKFKRIYATSKNCCRYTCLQSVCGQPSEPVYCYVTCERWIVHNSIFDEKIIYN